jgi:Gas vesicle synthesis protein GvpL/GvpF
MHDMSTYVYAVTGSAHPRPIDGLTGVGPQAPPLRVVRHDDLAAVVSDAPGSLRAKRRDLETHHGVLAALSEVGPVLPMRFGTLAPDDAAVQSRLAAGRDRYRELLSRVEGKVELNVKAAHREDAVLREMLLAHPTLLARHEALRGSGGGSYEAKVAFGARLMAALEERRARDAEHVLATLGPHASLTRPAPPVDGCFVNASFLVGAAGRQGFEASLAKLQHELATLAVVRVYGPLPPYSFVAIDEANG